MSVTIVAYGAGWPGKQADGRAKTREAKLCAVWSAERHDDLVRPVRDPGSVSYSTAIESTAVQDTDDDYLAIVQRVLCEAQRRGFEHAPLQVIVGEGALWIWNLASEHFPRSLQIVDRIPVVERWVAGGARGVQAAG